MTEAKKTETKKAAPKAEKPAEKKAPAAKAAASGKTIKLVRMGGNSRRNDRQIATLEGLGLFRRHQVKELQDTPAIRGMIAKVHHLVRVEE